MKRSAIIAAVLCLSLFSLSGCSQQSEQPAPQPLPAQEQVEVTTPSPAPAEQPAPEPEVQPEPEPELPAPDPIHHIPTGVWLAQTDVGYSNYYYFNSEEQNGTYLSLDYGLGMDFNYEGSGDELVFLMGDDAEAQSAVIEHAEGDSFTLLWENNLPETLEFVTEGTLDDFHFYSNDTLTRMAAAYYARSGNEPTSMAASITNEDNTVTVQLYDNLGDHNSTSAWYVLDRFTATGTDLMNGMEIDLLEHLNSSPDEEQLPAEGEELETPETEEPTVDELPAEDAAVEETPDETDEIQP